MSGEPVGKSASRSPSPADVDAGSSSTESSSAGPSSDDVDDAWGSAESPQSEERAKPRSELPPSPVEPGPVSERASVPSRPPAVRVSSGTSTEPTVRATPRRNTLLGVAPAPQTSSELTPPAPPSTPAPSSDDGASKFEAAARLLEQKRASLAPKPPTPATNDASTPERDSEDSILQNAIAEAPPLHDSAVVTPEDAAASIAPDDSADAPVATTTAEPEGRLADRPTEPGLLRAERDAARKARRRSAKPPAPRSSGLLPFALGAAVFAVMFMAGAMRAMRQEPSATPSTTTTAPIVETASRGDSPLPSSVPAAPPVSAAVVEPSLAESAAPVPSTENAAEAPSVAAPVASAEPTTTGETIRVMVRSAQAGAKFYRNGKQVGMNSIIVEIGHGETRTYEADLEGHVPRQVVVDGTRPEIVVILPRARGSSAPAQADTKPDTTDLPPSAPPPSESP